MFRITSYIFLILFTLSAQAQVKVSGMVNDTSNKPVAGVIVKMMSEGNMLAFTTTNSQGEYSLETKADGKTDVRIEFSHISYERKQEDIDIQKKILKLKYHPHA